MKFKSLLLASALVIAPLAASAQEVTTSANVAVTSDYVWRGVSQTDSKPGFSAGLDVASSNWYVGTWASNVDFGSDASVEVDLYGGFKKAYGPLSFDLGVIYYAYPSEDDANFLEYKGAATYTAANGIAVTGSVYYSPDFTKYTPMDTLYTEIAVSAPIPGAKIGPFALGVTGAYGNYDFGSSDYNNYKAAITATADKGWGLELGYTNTDVDNSDISDARGYLALKKTF